MRRPNHASRFEGIAKTNLQASSASDTETLQSQVDKAGKKRLSLSGLEILHGRLDKLFEKDRTAACESVDAPDWKYTIIFAPFIEFPYATFDDELIAELKDLICKALATQIRFRESKPAWAPDLPLSLNAGRELKRNRDPCVRLVGF